MKLAIKKRHPELLNHSDDKTSFLNLIPNSPHQIIIPAPPA
jgi:hypothetical protein